MFKKIFNFKEYDFRHYNMSILLTAFLLSFIGLTVIEVVQESADRLYEKQILGLVVGTMAALFVSLADYHYVCKFYVLFYFINMGLLLYTKFAGKSYHQALDYNRGRWGDHPDAVRAYKSPVNSFYRGDVYTFPQED